MHRKYKVNTTWTPRFAYAIGLIVSDGNLSPDGRHIHFTSKDYELARIFRSALHLNNKIGRKARGGATKKKYFVVQFGDINFYEFLINIGLTPAKSKTLGEILIPKKYFWDFLRGCIDGDGNISLTHHPESRHAQLRVRLCSASMPFLNYINATIHKLSSVQGSWVSKANGAHVLCYGKRDSIILINLLYYDQALPRLTRKYALAEQFIGPRGGIGRHAALRTPCRKA